MVDFNKSLIVKKSLLKKINFETVKISGQYLPIFQKQKKHFKFRFYFLKISIKLVNILTKSTN